MKRIESAANPLVKSLRRLAHPTRDEPRFLLEGRKLVAAALESGTELETLVLSESVSEEAEAFSSSAEVVILKEALFADVSTLETPEGILAVAVRSRSELRDGPAAGVLPVSCGIQDPGNLGAVARVAEASGASGLVVVKGSAHPFSPKALRGSMGSLLRLPVFEVEHEEVVRRHGYRLVALSPREGVDYREFEWELPVAVLLGRESSGLETRRADRADARVHVPMAGRVESLNVATVAALVLYEAARRGV